MIAIGADHGGYALKEELKKSFVDELEFKDFGPFSENPSDDYPKFAFQVSESVAKGECEAGILICRSGIGMEICANKVKGIRSANIRSVKDARHCKEDNNVNVIALSAEEVTLEAAREYIYAWLSADFKGGRHERRVKMICDYENQ